MSDVNVLKRIVDPLVELLAHKQLSISFSGDTPLTQYDVKTGKPQRIILPIVSSDADQTLIDTFHGYIDHEVGHVLFTDLQKGNLAKKMAGSALQTIFNMCEDPRIENAIVKRFKGSAHNINKLHERVFGDDYVAKISDDYKTVEHIFSSMIFAIRACCGQRHFKQKIDTNPKLAPMYQIISENFGDDLIAMRSSEDALKVAKKIFDMFGTEESATKAMSAVVKIEVEGDGEGASTSKEVSSSKTKPESKKKKSKAKKQSKSEKTEEKKTEESEESSEKGVSEKEKSDEKESEDKEQGGAESKQDDEKDDSEQKKDKSDSKEPEEKSEDESKDGEKSDSSEKESEVDGKKSKIEDEWIKPEDCEELYEKEIIRRMKFSEDERSPSGYTVYTTDKDDVSYISECTSDYPVDFMEQKTRSMTGTIQKTLERAMAAKSIARWHTGYRRGKLSASSLSRLFFGDDRIFRKKEMGISKDVAVTLLVDCSGSMRGQKSELAATSAYALASVLQNMNITSELIGFTTKGFHSRFGEEYSRACPLYMPIFKAFTDRWDIRAKRRLGKLWNEEWMCNNVDGECVQIAANRLMSRPESKKIMIVLSDGWPCADGDDFALRQHLKDTVQELEKKINIVGIGIISDAVETYYKKNVVLEDIKDLPGTVIKRVQELLLS